MPAFFFVKSGCEGKTKDEVIDMLVYCASFDGLITGLGLSKPSLNCLALERIPSS